MRKFALATVLALAAFGATAAEVKLEAQNSVGQNGTADQQVYEFGLKEKINNNFAGDVVVKNYRTDGTDVLSTRYEAGITASNTYGLFSPYTRVAIGEKTTSGSAGYGYYSVEPGVAVPLTAFPGTTVQLGYRYQDAFANGHSDLTRTWRSKLGYDINGTNNVYIGYDSQRGDSSANIVKAGYVHKF